MLQMTLTNAIESIKRADELQKQEIGDERPLRLVGDSIGALAAAFYAEKHDVDRLFLMSPVFGKRIVLPRTSIVFSVSLAFRSRTSYLDFVVRAVCNILA